MRLLVCGVGDYGFRGGGRLLFVLIGILILSGWVEWGRAENFADDSRTVEEIGGAVRNIFAEMAQAIVRVEAADHLGKLCGTGFFMDPVGTVLTLQATVGTAGQVTVVTNGKRLEADVLAADARSGLAILKVDRATPFIPGGRSSDLRLADPVLAIGFPRDLGASPSFGIVAGFDRRYMGAYFSTTHIRANLPVQAGFGGAPLLNFRGEVVGVLVAGLDGGGACYALPIEAAQKVMREVMRYGCVRYGWLGITVESDDGGEVRVAALGKETPASKAGLMQGDVLRRVADWVIDEVEDIVDVSFYLTAGEEVSVVVARDGRDFEVRIRAEEHPSNQRKEILAAHPDSFFLGAE